MRVDLISQGEPEAVGEADSRDEKVLGAKVKVHPPPSSLEELYEKDGEEGSSPVVGHCLAVVTKHSLLCTPDVLG